MEEKETHKTETRKALNAGNALNLSIFILSLSAAVLCAVFIYGKTKNKDAQPEKYINKTFNTQVEVLNACGKKGLTDLATDFLRKNQIDVVQARNYISFDLEKTLVIDRTGNREKAENIAAVLGVPASQVISQTNKDYLLDVSILLGKDYLHLKFSK